MENQTFIEGYKKYKEDIFALCTSTLVYTIMLPLIYTEHRRVEPRYIDFDIWFIHLKQMPMVLYILILTVALATGVNFFRDILGVIKKYLEINMPCSEGNKQSVVQEVKQAEVSKVQEVDHNVVHQYDYLATMESEFGARQKQTKRGK